MSNQGIIALLGLLLAIAAGPAAAHPAGPCGDHAAIVAHLEKEYGELPVVLALDATSRLLDIRANPETGTWTEMLVGPDGRACLTRSGTAWEHTFAPCGASAAEPARASAGADRPAEALCGGGS